MAPVAAAVAALSKRPRQGPALVLEASERALTRRARDAQGRHWLVHLRCLPGLTSSWVTCSLVGDVRRLMACAADTAR